MNELDKSVWQPHGPQSFDEIRISIASPERIRSWSYGEIKKARDDQLPDVQAGT